MFGIALAVMFNCVGEELDRFIEAAFAASHTPVERLNIAEGYVVVGLAQRGFGEFGDADRVFPFALLEQEPALKNLHDRCHARRLEFKSKVSSLPRKNQGLVVVAAAAEAAPLPVVGNG